MRLRGELHRLKPPAWPPMPDFDFNQNYFELFELPQQFEMDSTALGERFRQLQQSLHPDRFAAASGQEQRLAVQYSSFVNQAYNSLRRPLPRALYLLELAGMSAEVVSRQKVDGGFLIEQMELREKLEDLPDRVDPEDALDHLMADVRADLAAHQQEFSAAYAEGNIEAAASAAVKLQYLDKLMQEAEQAESALLD